MIIGEKKTENTKPKEINSKKNQTKITDFKITRKETTENIRKENSEKKQQSEKQQNPKIKTATTKTETNLTKPSLATQKRKNEKKTAKITAEKEKNKLFWKKFTEKQKVNIEKKPPDELQSERSVEILSLEKPNFSSDIVRQNNIDQTILLTHVAVRTNIESESMKNESKSVITLAVPDEQNRPEKL